MQSKKQNNNNKSKQNFEKCSRIFLLVHLMACRILVPGHGTKAMPLGVEAWSPDHWTAREFPMIKSLKKEINI